MKYISILFILFSIVTLAMIAYSYAGPGRYPPIQHYVKQYKIFEFQPLTNPDYTCVMIPQIDALQCFPANREDNTHVRKPK